MKFIKFILKTLAILLIVLAGLLFAAELFLGKAVVKGFNAAAPAALGVPASLEGLDLSLVRGRVVVRGLRIGNPPGYKTDQLLELGSVSLRLDNSTLLSDVVVVKEIAVDGLVVTYEKGLLDSNLGALIELLSAAEAPPQTEDKTPNEKTEDKPSGKKIVVEKLTIADSKMNFSVTGAAALTGGGSIPIPLPPITLTDLGKDKEGVTFVEALRRILTAIAGATGTAIAGSGKLLGSAVGAVGDGAWAVGEGAVGAGKAVVDGTVDTRPHLNPYGK